MALTYGWAYLEQTPTNMQLACSEPWELDYREEPVIDPYPGNTRVSYNLSEIRRVITLKGVIFKTTADAELALKNFAAMNAIGTSNLKLKIISGGTYFKVDGTNTTTAVFFQNLKLIKPSRGDGTVYKMDKIVLEQG